MRVVKILCAGDLHLGRVSGKCAPESEDTAAYSTRTAWGRLVDCAITRQVHLVLLSGDIADDGSNQYEAMGPFEAGIARLTGHGIHVVLVAGNHDARTLPQLLRICNTPQVHFLGHDGAWEQMHWPPDGPPQVTLVGWSYPAGRRVATLPLDALSLPPRNGVPVIGLAHADYRTTAGDYAATTPAALRRYTQVDLWLLGHIHAPEKLEGTPCILNPGSPQALDPGETGCHGPWLVEITGGAITAVEQIPLSSVAYAALTLDVAGMTDEDELLARLLPELQRIKEAYRRQDPPPRLSCRITLTGRTALLEKLHADRELILREQPLLDGHHIYIDQLNLAELRPDYDLATLGERQDAIGTLARLLTALDAPLPDEETAVYLRGASEVQHLVLGSPAFPDGVPREELPTPAAALKVECGRLLDALLRQEEART